MDITMAGKAADDNAQFDGRCRREDWPCGCRVNSKDRITHFQISVVEKGKSVRSCGPSEQHRTAEYNRSTNLRPPTDLEACTNLRPTPADFRTFSWIRTCTAQIWSISELDQQTGTALDLTNLLGFSEDEILDVSQVSPAATTLPENVTTEVVTKPLEETQPEEAIAVVAPPPPASEEPVTEQPKEVEADAEQPPAAATETEAPPVETNKEKEVVDVEEEPKVDVEEPVVVVEKTLEEEVLEVKAEAVVGEETTEKAVNALEAPAEVLAVAAEEKPNEAVEVEAKEVLVEKTEE
ncbi:hypothetical protein RHGRI_037138 [Rhododendron griersonianum]|uniref:Uncharacterized protein n=1 Tax=Rhododendron griersonianum TaxID=479676 RepID=A0AAV6HU47_9ERIC|nr:hypothetical protein RHGRI_037138 [Rhododendron griersonianum]